MSFSSPSRDRVGPAMPLASMLDIMFLLLIFFVTTSAMREEDQQVDVNLPAYASQSRVVGRTQTILTVNAEGQVYIGNRKYDLNSLQGMLQSLAQASPNESVVIRGDQDCKYGIIMRVQDLVQGAGLRNVGQAVVKPKNDL